MIEDKLDANLIETELYTLIKSVYSGNVYCGNRPNVSEVDLDDFIVVKSNGSSNPMIATDRVINSTQVCLVQIWTKDLQGGLRDMSRQSEIRTDVFSKIPSTVNGYRFTYKGEVGSRDILGYHCNTINLNCLIF